MRASPAWPCTARTGREPTAKPPRLNGTPSESFETGFELTYSDNLTPWLAIQPDVQYILNPGTDPAADNALLLGTRLTLTF